jgi:GT2 family glycosyltransferase
LNQDCIVHADLVSELTRPFDESAKLAVTAPIQFDLSFSSIHSFFIREYLSLCPDLFYDALNQQIKPFYKLDFAWGACLAIKSDFISKYGLFDPIYFMYWEDVDLCRKMRNMQFDIALVPRAKVAHGQSKVSSLDEHKRKIRNWERYSRSIFEIKDPNISILTSCLKLCHRSLIEYISLFTSLKLLALIDALTTDIKLVINLPRVISSRNAEINIISRSIRTI